MSDATLRAVEAAGRNPVRAIFTEAAPSYRLINGLLSIGLDSYWRGRAVDAACRAGGRCWLDVCTGTGDLALRLRRQAPAATTVIGSDFSPPMIRQSGAVRINGLSFVLGESARLPFRDGAFDVITISFAVRNLAFSAGGLDPFLREFRRVAAPGAALIMLETTRPGPALLRWVLNTYAGTVVTTLGGAISGSAGAYRYLGRTIRSFYGAEELARRVKEAGFAHVRWQTLFPGVVALHQATA